MARIKKDLEDPEGAPRHARERERRRARRAEEKKRRQQEHLDEWLREIRRPRPMIERNPGAFPREQVQAYWREKRVREVAQQHELSLRRILRNQGLSEDEIEAKVDEQMARLESFRQRFSLEAGEDQDK
jgi:hypothetical protein